MEVIVFRGKIHIVMGLTLGLILVEKLMIPYDSSLLIYLTGVSVGTLLPDADHQYATMGKLIPLWLFVSHRTITHSLVVLVVPISMVKLFPDTYYFSMGLFIGVICHFAGDILNPTGVPLFYPLIKTKINLANLKTGSFAEDVLFLIFMISFLAISYKMFW